MPQFSQIRLGVVLNYINLIIGGFIPLIYTPIMLRLLGQNEYGLYKLSSNVTSYLWFVTLGLGAAITRFLIKAREENGSEGEERMLGLFIIIFRFIALFTFIIGICLSLNLHILFHQSLSDNELYTMRILVFLLASNTAINFLSSPYIAITTTHERFIFIQVISLLITCFAPILNLIVLYLGFASVGLAISTLFVTIVSRIAYYIYTQKVMCIKPKFGKIQKTTMIDIANFSFWIFVSGISSQLYSATDSVLIGTIPKLSVVGVAIYSVGVTFSGMVNSICAGLSSMLMPRANKMVFNASSNEDITKMAIKVGRIQSMIISLFLFGFIPFGHPFIHFYFGNEYIESYWIAILYMFPYSIPLLQSFCLNIVIARNENRFRAKIYLLIAIINAIGTWLVLPYLGIKGAALISGISIILGHGFIMNYFYAKKMKINIPLFWKQVGKTFILPLMMSFIFIAISYFINLYDIKLFITNALIFFIIYICGCWKFTMNEYEKMLCKNIIGYRKNI